MIDAKALAARLEEPVVDVRRRPYPYRTSHHLEQLEVELAGGSRRLLLLKHVRRSKLSAKARRAKPQFLHDPRREAEAYRLLEPAGLGVPACYGANDDWLLIEQVPGVELWQLGEIEPWARAAAWLRRLHDRFAVNLPESDHLLKYDAAHFRLWPERAARLHPELAPVVVGYERIVRLLTDVAPTFVHGEFYASNVLVTSDRVAPVDWEMAGIGPGVVDLAALATGWAGEGRSEILDAYGAVAEELLDAARLHLALQWLGWSDSWTAPPEHSHDWLGEALLTARRLGL